MVDEKLSKEKMMDDDATQPALKNPPEVLAQRDRLVEQTVANFERSGLLIMADTVRLAGELARDIKVEPNPPAPLT